MGFPSREKICAALLVHLHERGGEKHAIPAGNVYEPLADRLGLAPADRSVSRKEMYGDRRTEPAWHSAVQYARRDLVKRGLISRDGGVGIWMLTAEGVTAAEQAAKRGGAS